MKCFYGFQPVMVLPHRQNGTAFYLKREKSYDIRMIARDFAEETSMLLTK